ncbi:hypothetical protein [Paraburkholderia humisilvae]|uniref:Uncharacterized protein n=1 Tax=Paraburkholderia humisilvae TaxID=627669 RepID=A0A6J5E212_9BURK|nr:hypothetical protein [Paraburkholderia humisilvae]CAB3760353.1 hypothetical protein LMG29542_03820 [Paraburkholderia humisilvae]
MEDSTDETPKKSSRFANVLTKVLLFVGLYLLAVLFLSTYPFPMTIERMRWWSAFSAQYGISNPEDAWVTVILVMDLVVTIFVYLAVVKRVEALASEIPFTPSCLVKTTLFIGLFLLIMTYVLEPMEREYTHWGVVITGKLGIGHSNDFELSVILLVDLIFTTLVYKAIMKGWRIFQTRRRSNRPA